MVNLHMLFVGLGSVVANVERDNAEGGAETRHDVNTHLQLETDVAVKPLNEPQFQKYRDEAEKKYSTRQLAELRQDHDEKSGQGKTTNRISQTILLPLDLSIPVGAPITPAAPHSSCAGRQEKRNDQGQGHDQGHGCKGTGGCAASQTSC